MILKLFDRFYVSKDFFEFNIKFLFLVGLWPEDLSKHQLILYKVYQNTLHCFAIIFFLITGYQTYEIRSDLILFLANIDKSIVAYNYFFKSIIFLMRRKELKHLMDDIFLSGDRVQQESRNNMIRHLVLITVLITGLISAFSLLGLYNDEMTVEAWMPFDAKKNKVNLTLAALIMGVLIFVPFLYRAMGMQGMVCSILIYLCDQLVTLQDAIKNLDYSKGNEREAKEKLKEIIKKHIRLMRYSNSMQTMFKEYFLIQNLSVTMELCLNAMLVTMVGTDQMFLFTGFVAFLVLALFNAYIYCYLGNELIDQSEALAFAAYSSDWTSWPLDMKKDVLLMIKAAQRPLQMSAGGVAVISMQTYGTALYNGYSIFAVLSDVVEK